MDAIQYIQELNKLAKSLIFFAPAVAIFWFQDWSKSTATDWIVRGLGVALILSGAYVLFK